MRTMIFSWRALIRLRRSIAVNAAIERLEAGYKSCGCCMHAHGSSPRTGRVTKAIRPTFFNCGVARRTHCEKMANQAYHTRHYLLGNEDRWGNHGRERAIKASTDAPSRAWHGYARCTWPVATEAFKIRTLYCVPLNIWRQ